MGYLEASDSFTIKSGEQQSRNVSLLEAGSTPDIHVAQTSGVRKMFSNKVNGIRLTVRTTPPGATILINGQAVGKTTPVDFGLNPGNYVMEIQLAGYQTLNKTITVEENKPMVLDETLHP
jgi:phosphatidate phosphatase APP1